MKSVFNITRAAVLVGVTSLCFAVNAGTLQLDIELPKYNDGNTYRPYVAAWVEQDRKAVAHLFVWYKDYKVDRTKGFSWLKELRQWWRKVGRDFDTPIDSLTRATRKPGNYTEIFDATSPIMQQLRKNNQYVLRVEVLREKSGREIINLPFTYGDKVVSVMKKGEVEVGEIKLTVTP